VQPLNPVLSSAVITEINADRRARGQRVRRFARRGGLAPSDGAGPRGTRAARA
jgi:hypothetical protein